MLSRSPNGQLLNLVVFLVVLALCIRFLHRTERAGDPRVFVADEFLGMHASLLIAASVDMRWIVAQFVVFRVLDVVKPPPFNWVERKANGRYGLLVDDIVIGIVGGIGFRLLLVLLPFPA